MSLFMKLVTGEVNVIDVMSDSVKELKSTKPKRVKKEHKTNAVLEALKSRRANFQTLQYQGKGEVIPSSLLDLLELSDKEEEVREEVKAEYPNRHDEVTTPNRYEQKKEPVRRGINRTFKNNETLAHLDKLKKGGTEYVLGEVNGEVIIQSLEKEPHLMIGGYTGSGKTVTTMNILVSLVSANTPQTLEFTLIDLKMLTFGDKRISNTKFLHNKEVALNRDSALERLSDARDEMMERYSRMMSNGVKDYRKINIPTHVIVIDEVAELFSSITKKDREQTEEIKSHISSIAAMGRQAGVFLLMATQRPSAETLSGKLKANLSVIGLKVKTSTDAKILGLGSDDRSIPAANLLRGNGHGLKVLNGETTVTEFQSTFIDIDSDASYQYF